MNEKATLSDKLVGEISGKFIVKSYQRGYRWDDSQVKALLKDISDCGSDPYCLQPIVVRKISEGTYELIDGQQRLTTLWILLKYIQKEYKQRITVKYSLEYETRDVTTEFLNNITPEESEKDVDCFFIYKAYQTIDRWFKDLSKEPNKDVEVADDLFGSLNKNVKVIWYEVADNVDPIALFARLNIGKIALTNAELVKALFLMKTGREDWEKEQIEISLQWDDIEHSLHSYSDEFWYFLTKQDPRKYPTRIELLFDFIAGKKDSEREAFYTFFYFEKEINKNKEEGVKKVWLSIQQAFLQLKEWFSNSIYYHKVGYLIASGTKQMPELLLLAEKKRKQDFLRELDELIAQSIRTEKEYKELSYDKDYSLISRILLLFNVQSIIDTGSNQRFPFSKYNTREWSLEHIHAKQSEGLRTNDNRIDWLKTHLEYVKTSTKEVKDLYERMQNAVEIGMVSQQDFERMAADAFIALSEDESIDYVDLISNMALLSREINSTLSNSVFAVKRDAIIGLDKQGAFIPYCTKMAFLKYYTHSTNTHFSFWGADDREAYLAAMKDVLTPYLTLINADF